MRVYDIEDLPLVEKICQKYRNVKPQQATKCNGKSIYKTKHAAESTANVQIRIGNAKKLKIYHCPWGNHYHLTSPGKKRFFKELT